MIIMALGVGVRSPELKNELQAEYLQFHGLKSLVQQDVKKSPSNKSSLGLGLELLRAHASPLIMKSRVWKRPSTRTLNSEVLLWPKVLFPYTSHF